METYYVGIDPGKKGAVGILTSSGLFFDTFDCDGSPDAICDALENFPDKVIVTIEKGRQFFGMKGRVIPTAVLYGCYTAWLQALHMTESVQAVTVVDPNTWTKYYWKKKHAKEDAMDLANAKFDLDKELYGPKGGQRNDRADALLIAEYGRTVPSES